MDGDTLLVGARLADGADKELAGAVYVFELIDNAWVETQKLTASDGLVADDFGSVLCLDGDRALIAAPNKRGPGGFMDDAGQVYVFEREAGVWHETATIRAHDTDQYRYFGHSLAFSGDTALMGTHNHPNGTGYVYVFERIGSDWVETGHLFPQDPVEGDDFGAALALSEDGQTAYIGMPGDAGGPLSGYDSFHTGSIRVYRKIGTTWVQTHVLRHSYPETHDSLGVSLAVDGNTLLAGLQGLDQSGAVSAWGVGAPDCSLGADAFLMSLAEGAIVNLSLDAGPEHAGRLFLLLGTTAGAEPGLVVGNIVLPLNYDGPGGYLWQTFVSPNTPPLSNSMGVLDASGRSQTVFLAPAASDPALAGLTLHHAYVVFDGTAGQVVFVSNPVHLGLGE